MSRTRDDQKQKQIRVQNPRNAETPKYMRPRTRLPNIDEISQWYAGTNAKATSMHSRAEKHCAQAQMLGTLMQSMENQMQLQMTQVQCNWRTQEMKYHMINSQISF